MQLLSDIQLSLSIAANGGVMPDSTLVIRTLVSMNNKNSVLTVAKCMQRNAIKHGRSGHVTRDRGVITFRATMATAARH
jgi:hypothetical protein